MTPEATVKRGPSDAELELAESLRVSLMRISRLIRAESSDGITAGQHSVLSALSTADFSTLQELANREHVQPPAMTRMIAGLVARGLVERVITPDDRRRVSVSLTAQGLAALEGNRKRRNHWLASRLSELSDESRARLAAAAPVLAKIADGWDGRSDTTP